ncbi:hypothetical protein ABEZ87_32545, partial [Bacillus mycoides]|uniref:hypothetical protein n=1 Tax=Bacillus mycoides TaxID=1405 RepID=UPI003D233FE5
MYKFENANHHHMYLMYLENYMDGSWSNNVSHHHPYKILGSLDIYDGDSHFRICTQKIRHSIF